jgi:putative colanic acid biosynthesis acetyltransferase WcaF
MTRVQGGGPPDAPTSRMAVRTQRDPYSSPWSVRHRLRVLAWTIVRATLFRPTPKPLYRWRVLLLRLFGCRVHGRPFVAASAVIREPWNLTLEDRACLGPGSEVYNLGLVTIGEGATVAQQAYLCCGTHDFADPTLPLVVGPIDIGPHAFIGARAFILPGVMVGARAIVGACAVVTRDVPPNAVAAGNPARVIGQRPLSEPDKAPK